MDNGCRGDFTSDPEKEVLSSLLSAGLQCGVLCPVLSERLLKDLFGTPKPDPALETRDQVTGSSSHTILPALASVTSARNNA